MGAKNPRRQAGQYRRMVESHSKLVWIVALFWLVPLAVVIAGWYWEWPLAVTLIAGIAVVSGLIQHVTEIVRLREFRTKLAAAEERARQESADALQR